MYGFQGPGNQIKNKMTYNSAESIMPAANKVDSQKDLWSLYKNNGKTTNPQPGGGGGGGGFDFANLLKNNAGGILSLISPMHGGMFGGGGAGGGGMPGIAGIIGSLFGKK